jgi:GWxTD domain-containing protein
LDKSRTVRVPSFQGRDLQIAGPLFIHPSHRTADSSIVGPINAGGDLLFGAPASLYCEVVSPAPPGTPVFVSYSIAEVEGGKTEAPVLQDSLAGLAPDSAGVLTLPRAHASAHYVVRPGPRRGVALVIPFPAERLMLRPMKLTLRIRQGSWEQTVVRPFRMVWPEMPYSLRDVDYALDMLRYITTGRELDSLESGGYETRRANLEEFWRRKDPTPGTAMNDVMTEYYRRVDHSMRSFASLRQPDGARTDRGKIYILYGPPSRVDRALDPREGFRETWSYERLGREFVFADASKNGVYVLAPSPQP